VSLCCRYAEGCGAFKITASKSFITLGPEDEDDGRHTHGVEGVDDVALEQRDPLLELVDHAAERGSSPDRWPML
jgi:hypothetical protein